MKKILASIIALFAVLTVSAKQVIPLSFSSIAEDGTVGSWAWCQMDLSMGQWNYTEDRKDSTWISFYDYTDASDYDYVVVAFDETNVTTDLWVIANNWAANQKVQMAAGSTYVALQFEGSAVADLTDKITSLVLQPNGEGILKVKEVSFMTEDEFAEFKEAEDAKEKSVVLNSGYTTTMDASIGGWYSPGWMGQTGLAQLYKTVVVEIASSDGPFCFKLQGVDPDGNWTESGFEHTTYYIGKVTEPIQIAIPIETINGGVGQFAFANYNAVSGVYATDEEGNKIEATGDQAYNGYQVNWTCAATTVSLTKIYATSNVVESSSIPAFPGFPEPTMPSDKVKGDVNGDGEVGIADANAIIAIICGGEEYKDNADVTGDGSVGIEDVNATIAIICGGE